MWFIPIICCVLLAIGSVRFGFYPSPNARTVLKIRDDGIHVTRGRLKYQVRQDLMDVLNQAGVTAGFITFSSSSHLNFSRRIPGEVRQRLRNVLVNQ